MKWLSGMRGEGTCDVCRLQTGSRRHKLTTCDGLISHMNWQAVMGRLPREPKILHDVEYFPLTLFGMPPNLDQWKPVRARAMQGTIGSTAQPGEFYGDGSGVKQHSLAARRTTFSVYRLCDGGEDFDEEDEQGDTKECISGSLTGWFLTSQRGELAALLYFLQYAPKGSSYAGDCAYVMRGIIDRVPWKLRAAGSVDADLWKTIFRLSQERVGWHTFRKVKAHRSRAQINGGDRQDVKDWHGNDEADWAAKSLARRITEGQPDPAERRAELGIRAALLRIAVAAGWSLKQTPEGQFRKRRGPRSGAERGRSVLEVGTHAVRSRPSGGVECTRCRLYAATPASLKALRQLKCRGDVAGQAHPSHLLRTVEGVIYCRNCGAYATKRPTALKLACVKRPPTEARANVLKRMAVGLLPTTARYLQNKVNADRRATEAAAAEIGGSTINRRRPSPPDPHHHPHHAQPDPGGFPRDDHGDADVHELAVHVLDGGNAGADREGDERDFGRLGGMHDAHGAAASSSDMWHDRGTAVSSHLRQRRGDGERVSVDGPTSDAFGGEEGGTASGTVMDGREAMSAVAGGGSEGCNVVTPPTDKWCRPPPGASWVNRLVIRAKTPIAACHNCGGATRARCRGCMRMLCMACAKSLSDCRVETPVDFVS